MSRVCLSLSLPASAVLVAVTAVLAVGGLPPESAVASQATHPEFGPPSMSVVGEGVVATAPGLARTVLGVEVTDVSLASSLRQAAERMDQVIATLLSKGVRREDIRTIRFQVNPQYDRRDGGSRLVGYRVSNAVQVRTEDIAGLGELIDAAVEAGAARVEGVFFEVTNPAELKAQAREEAVKNARAKAEHLARLTGVALGLPIRIQEADPGGVVPVQVPRAALAAEAATPIEPGQLEVRTQVHITYSIQ